MGNSKESIKTLKSYAKINLFLKVVSKRKDGFHNIFSYLLPINFYDEIIFKEIGKGKFEVETIGADIKKEENLAYKAGLKILKYAKNKRGIEIKIIKKIPLGSGLGGGSSNCASVLKFLNRFWECNLEKKKLIEIALELGSDVPFFIEGKPALIAGKGEKIKFCEINLKIPKKIVLFIPNISISTRDVYNVFDKFFKKKQRFDTNNFLKNLSFENLTNDLQEPAFVVNPDLRKIFDKIKETKPSVVLLSGSGSSFWGFYKNKEIEEKAKRLLTNFVKFYIVSFKKFLPL